MTREKAIEAAAERQARIGKEEFGGPGDPDEFREDAVKIVNACAPHIESALLDRIEEAVEGMKNPYATSDFKDGFESAREYAQILLTEIRQGLDPAQSPEAGK